MHSEASKLAFFTTVCLLGVDITGAGPAMAQQRTVVRNLGSAINLGSPSDKGIQSGCAETTHRTDTQWGETVPHCPETSVARPSVERKVQPVTEIENDSGGLVADYAMRLYELREAKQRVKFVGRCDSACTLLLALPAEQTCITAETYFRFHAPTAPTASAAAAVGDYMMRKYPKWVRAWIVAQGGLSDRLATMGYEYAIKFMRACSLTR